MSWAGLVYCDLTISFDVTLIISTCSILSSVWCVMCYSYSKVGSNSTCSGKLMFIK